MKNYCRIGKYFIQYQWWYDGTYPVYIEKKRMTEKYTGEQSDLIIIRILRLVILIDY